MTTTPNPENGNVETFHIRRFGWDEEKGTFEGRRIYGLETLRAAKLYIAELDAKEAWLSYSVFRGDEQVFHVAPAHEEDENWFRDDDGNHEDIVFVAYYNQTSPQTRYHVPAAVFGYFATREEIPAGWKMTGTEDIGPVMAGRLTKEQALVMMNRQWKK